MNLIDKFESLDEQNVKNFNKIFKCNQLKNLDDNLEVRILEVLSGGEREVLVGNNKLRMALLQKRRESKSKTKNFNIVLFDEKACSKCKIVKPFSEFSPHKTSKGGVRSACKMCCVLEVRKSVKKRLTQGFKNDNIP